MIIDKLSSQTTDWFTLKEQLGFNISLKDSLTYFIMKSYAVSRMKFTMVNISAF